MRIPRAAKWFAALLLLAGLGPAGWIGYRTWPRKLPAPPPRRFPKIFFADGHMGIALPTEALVADLGPYGDALNTYLYLDLIRSFKSIDSTRVMACSPPDDPQAPRRIYLSVDNNLLTSIPYLNSLTLQNPLSQFSLHSWTRQDLNRCQDHSIRFDASFRLPVFTDLPQIQDAQLVPPLAEFLVFKSATDRRVLQRTDPPPPVLNLDQARELAADIIVVARFYGLPLEYFLGIGAVENNYMDVRGDLEHTVWKHRPQRGDIVLKRRRRRVLVLNYSLGVWQITRETLRRAQSLYLEDRKTRDYSLLPDRLRPEINADPDDIQPETLTTYAGLLFRHLLDHFDGNIMQAVGAYNGGVDKPNLAYADSVRTVAFYARRVITHSVATSSSPFSPSTSTHFAQTALHQIVLIPFSFKLFRTLAKITGDVPSSNSPFLKFYLKSPASCSV
jgi:hypothetical protein